MHRTSLFLATILSVPLAIDHGQAADLSCNGLVPDSSKLICPGFEPNWGVELLCNGTTMSANYLDAFTGDGIQSTPGTVTFATQDPWAFETSHGISAEIAYTPAACIDEGDYVHDFTMITIVQPDYSGPITEICCRME